jgi:hypothetical protein
MAYIGNQPAETPVKEILETDIKIGEDDQTKIDFADANNINFHADNAKEMVLSANALTPGTSDGTALGTTSLMWSDLFLASGGVMNFNNGNVTITHTNGTGLTINSTNKLMFGDSASFVQQSSDGVLRIDGEATVDINASTAVTVSNDLKLDSDSAVLGFGADNDTTLTHTDGTGLTLNSTNKLTFGDAASFIHQSTDGTLTIDGEAIIDLNASTRVDVSGDLKVGSNIELGNASDTTLARSAAGEVTIEGVAIKKVGLENIWVPATAMTPSETNGCASLTSVETSSGRPDLIVLDFDKDSDEFAHFSIAMPKSWNEGTITFQAYWTSASTNTGTVAWAMSGVSFGDNDLIDQDYGTTVVATAKAHSGTAEDLNISAVSGNLTVANAAADELAFFEIFRDVSADSHTSDARLLGVKIFYTTDTSTDA